MNKMMFGCCVVIGILMSQTVDAKVANYYSLEQSNMKSVNCLDEANDHYYDCTLECISKDSPKEVIAFCSNKCNSVVNKSFYRCIFAKKYIR